MTAVKVAIQSTESSLRTFLETARTWAAKIARIKEHDIMSWCWIRKDDQLCWTVDRFALLCWAVISCCGLRRYLRVSLGLVLLETMKAEVEELRAEEGLRPLWRWSFMGPVFLPVYDVRFSGRCGSNRLSCRLLPLFSRRQVSGWILWYYCSGEIGKQVAPAHEVGRGREILMKEKKREREEQRKKGREKWGGYGNA